MQNEDVHVISHTIILLVALQSLSLSLSNIYRDISVCLSSYYFITCILPEVKILALLLHEMISISITDCF